MAVLQDADRIAVWLQFMRENRAEITGALTKAELRAAVDAADQWVSDNASSFNTALPVAARTALNASQKAAILMFVVAKRFGSGV